MGATSFVETLIWSVVILGVYSQDVLVFPSETVESCVLGEGQTGQCLDITSCPTALQSISGGRTPKICRFEGKTPIVCCPQRVATILTTSPKVEKKQLPNLRVKGCGVRTNSSLVRETRAEDIVKRRATALASNRPSIAGGTDSVPFAWPWMVAIFSRAQSPKARFLCGGSLISDLYVLTAAHCFINNRNPENYYVVVEAHERSRGNSFTLASITVHENYTSRFYYNDIAILRLLIPTDLNRKVWPVCLPDSSIASRNLDGKAVTVTGWGDTSFGGVDSRTLREATVNVVPKLRCNATYSALSKARFPKGIDNGMICAGVMDGSKDACMGDSGGPLVLMDGVWIQIGIVSFGFRCAEPGFPGVYTRVVQYLDWIEKHTDIPQMD